MTFVLIRWKFWTKEDIITDRRQRMKGSCRTVNAPLETGAGRNTDIYCEPHCSQCDRTISLCQILHDEKQRIERDLSKAHPNHSSRGHLSINDSPREPIGLHPTMPIRVPSRRNLLADAQSVSTLPRAIFATHLDERIAHLLLHRVEGAVRRGRAGPVAVHGFQARLARADLEELVCSVERVGEQRGVHGLVGVVGPADPSGRVSFAYAKQGGSAHIGTP